MSTANIQTYAAMCHMFAYAADLPATLACYYCAINEREAKVTLEEEKKNQLQLWKKT